MQKDAEKIKAQLSILESLGVTSEEDLDRAQSVWLVDKSQARDRKGLRTALGEMMGVLERRSELTEQIRTKHREFSQLKALQQKFSDFGEKIKQTTADVREDHSLQSRSKSPAEEVEGLEDKEKQTREQKRRLRSQLLGIRRRLVALAKNNQALYEEMESAERLSFKLFYYLLSLGQNTRVTPVIDKSLLQATLRKADEIDAVFKSKARFMSMVKQASAKARALTGVQCEQVLGAIWDKALRGGAGPFSLFEEFKVKIAIDL